MNDRSDSTTTTAFLLSRAFLHYYCEIQLVSTTVGQSKSPVAAALLVVNCGDLVLSDDSTLMPSNASNLRWISGVEARIQFDCSLSECITTALDSLKGSSFY